MRSSSKPDIDQSSSSPGRIAIGLAAFVILTAVAALFMPRSLWGLAAAADLPPWCVVLGTLLVVFSQARGFERGMEGRLDAIGRSPLAPVLVP